MSKISGGFRHESRVYEHRIQKKSKPFTLLLPQNPLVKDEELIPQEQPSDSLTPLTEAAKSTQLKRGNTKPF